MRTEQLIWKNKSWVTEKPFSAIHPEIVLVFGQRDLLRNRSYFNKLREKFPDADLLISSTSGEISGDQMLSGSIVATAIQFENTRVEVKKFSIRSIDQSEAIGNEIAHSFKDPELRMLFVLSDGQKVNGSDLVSGINSSLTSSIPVTGGLAGDEDRFEKTLVGLNEIPKEGNLVVMGLSGLHLKIGCGSRGGWEAFGHECIITRSKGNVLYELDGACALDAYKQYLGDRSKDLPASALLFPMSLTEPKGGKSRVRTILSINDKENSMIFAGNMPEGYKVRLMKASVDRLVDGANKAANDAMKSFENGNDRPDLAILVSCVGRKIVMGQMTVDEIEEAQSIIGPGVCYTGFYSYGEIAPHAHHEPAELLNQTISITTIKETKLAIH